ncbi:MAG: chorismate mutase [Anaerolineae bacterium]
MSVCRGVRGATTVDSNEREAILQATRELLLALVEANGLQPADLASAVFSLTADLDAAFPAEAARQLGWAHVPLLDVQEASVSGALRRCIRVLLHWNTERKPEEIVHVYLRGAEGLRPDLRRPE